MQCLVNMANESELPRQVVNSFCLAIKETHGLEVSSEILGIFY